MHWYIVVTQLAITYFMWSFCDYIKNRSPINIINGVTLPAIDDPRWKLIERKPKTGTKYWTLQMNNIRISQNKDNYCSCININNVNVFTGTVQVGRYVDKVFINYFNKISMSSIQETKFLELE